MVGYTLLFNRLCTRGRAHDALKLRFVKYGCRTCVLLLNHAFYALSFSFTFTIG